MTAPREARVEVASALTRMDACACCLKGLHESNGNLPPEVHAALEQASDYLHEAIVKVEDAHSRLSNATDA